ncbi:cyclic nucleotide-binding protein [Gemmatirosa kalamazoonensis]|uniref:Cyclic nucleotide-binding protein n=1 Tax=Gemmatirosa kalamazoonensis TaxID=861299 RepID=W0RB82_9BACT|nr:Crp/Fnr family transcriptional regulator [Gemmatirosa kalamazoonensis]AHG88056.1 cyclic nucleotide-binding protein [Gemmatirosa kalamazoonensis]
MQQRCVIQRLSPDVRAALASYGAKASWPAGFGIYQRGAPADGVFVVLSGRIVLRSRVKAGRGFVPAIATDGETFGAEGLEIAGRYATDARAEEPSETLHLSGARFRAFLREQPLYAQSLIGQIMAERTQLLDKLHELATLSVEERLIASMLRLADQSRLADGRPLRLGSTDYRLLCELVGATRESVSLVFNRLVGAGLVEREGTTYTIPDLHALGSRLGATWSDSESIVPLVDESRPADRVARI